MVLLAEYHGTIEGETIRCRIYQTRRKGHAAYLYTTVYEVQEFQVKTGKWARVGTTNSIEKVNEFQGTLEGKGLTRQ